MKIIVKSVFSLQDGRTAIEALGNVYLNGELMAWIGFMSKEEIEAEPGENTIEILFENAVNGSKKIKFYATEDVHIFVRLAQRSIMNDKFTIYTLLTGDDLKIIEESGTIK